MPFISLLTCIFIGWVIKPKWICDEMESSGHPFGRKKLYIVYDPVCGSCDDGRSLFTVRRRFHDDSVLIQIIQ